MAKRAIRNGKRPARRLPRRALTAMLWVGVVLLMGGAVCLGSRAAWQAISHRPEFRLDPLALNLSGHPRWVNGPAMARELRSRLSQVPRGRAIFDRDIARTIAQELGRSPWVLEVTKVEKKLPDTFLVEAIFRKPAGLVLMDGTHYMVDSRGHWLRDELFHRPQEWEPERLPRIVDRLLRESPPLGRPWDGPRLAAGARLSEFLRQKGLLDELHLATIDVTGVGRAAAEPDIVLTTVGGARVKWGRSSVYERVPGLEGPLFQPPDVEKLEMLLSKLNERPELKRTKGWSMDLRFHGQIVFAPSD